MLFHTYKDVEVETAQMAERTLNQHTAFLPIHSITKQPNVRKLGPTEGADKELGSQISSISQSCH